MVIIVHTHNACWLAHNGVLSLKPAGRLRPRQRSVSVAVSTWVTAQEEEEEEIGSASRVVGTGGVARNPVRPDAAEYKKLFYLSGLTGDFQGADPPGCSRPPRDPQAAGAARDTANSITAVLRSEDIHPVSWYRLASRYLSTAGGRDEEEEEEEEKKKKKKEEEEARHGQETIITTITIIIIIIIIIFIITPSASVLNSAGLLTASRSPTSSEDEMAQSFSDYSDDSASNSSHEETIYETIRATAPVLRMEDVHTHSLVVRVVIPDLQQTKCMRFNPDATVWVAKQRILCTLSQSLKDVLNYGLFQPASNGRDGKFLDEERLIREYPQPISKGVPSLEFRYKSRVYRQPHVDEKQIAKLHTKANLRKFMELIQHHHVDKVSKMLERGLDPNYHDTDTGVGIKASLQHLGHLVHMVMLDQFHELPQVGLHNHNNHNHNHNHNHK
ncbi:hypothetical protein CRUP_020254 [Coryphaenoides rupestris]|nr:hypothetical protein CRUP_020254 [Coryphaenoides rupestris]